jgi:hypothetical protein
MSKSVLEIVEVLKVFKLARIFDPNSNVEYDWTLFAVFLGVAVVSAVLLGFRQVIVLNDVELGTQIKWYRWVLSSRLIPLASVRALGPEKYVEKPQWWVEAEGEKERLWLPRPDAGELAKLMKLREALRPLHDLRSP